MGLLKLLGIEKYLKKVKTYVDEKANELDGKINNIKPGDGDGKTAWQNYQEWSEMTDGFWQNEEAYNKYLSVRDGMCGIDTRIPMYNYGCYEKWVSWDTYGFTWYQFVTIKDRNPEYATVEDYSSGEGLVVTVRNPEAEDPFMLRINPNNETIYLIGY